MAWPHGHRSAVAFTFDFDAESVWVADDPQNASRPGVLSQGRFGARVGVALILDVLRHHEVKATFFVPGVVAEEHTARVQAIVDAGHELGLHGYTHNSPADMTSDEEHRELERAISALAPFGAEPSGYRSPSWELSDLTLQLLEEHGLRYSSNLMDDIRPYVHPGTSLVELPVQWLLDDAPYWWFSAADWNRRISTTSEVREIWLSEFLGIHAHGGCSVFTMHPQLIGRPSRVTMLDELIAFVKSHQDVWIGTCQEIADAVPRVRDSAEIQPPTPQPAKRCQTAAGE